MALALPIWTLVVWLTRVRNVLRAGDAMPGVLVPAGLCALAAYAFVDRRRGVVALTAATVAVWAVRLPMVLVHDHPAAFKVVHAVLAAVSLLLAAAAVRSVLAPRARQAAPVGPPASR